MDIDLSDIPIEIQGSELVSLAGPSNETEGYFEGFDYDIGSDKESEDSDPEEPSWKPIRAPSKLSPHLKGLMGEANLRYARGDLETSKKMCFEVIRQAPEAFEPYLTLSQMYETSNLKKYKGYLMLASHLSPSNYAILSRLAEVFLQEGNTLQAIRTYSKVIAKNPKMMEFHKKRIELLEKKGEMKNLLVAKLTMAKYSPRKDHDLIIKLTLEVAKEYFENKSYHRAVEALRIPLKRIPQKITKDVINMIMELLILLERYSECLDVLTQFCGFTFDVSITEENNLHINSFEKPEPLHVDLKFRFYIVLVKLRAEHLFVDLIDKILIENNIDSVSDLYFDLIEALMGMNYHSIALKLLDAMVKSQANSAATWLKYAECLTACSMPDQAIEAYYTVKSLAPAHVEVLYPLAMLLLQQNKKDEALEVLSQDSSTNKLDVAVLVEQMKLLKQINDWDSYWNSVELLLSRHCVILKNPEELKIVTVGRSFKEKLGKIKKMRSFRNEPVDIEPDIVTIREPSVEEEYNFFKELMQRAMDQKEYALFQKFTFMAMCSKKFQKYFKEIFILGLYASILNRDLFHSYSMARDLLLRYPKNNLVWNLFNLVISNPDETRYLRFLDRYKDKFSLEDRILVTANNATAVGNYEASVRHYLKHYKQTKSTFSYFMLGVSMLQYYSQRKVDSSKKKMLAETITYLFLDYAKIRSKTAEQEVYYNLGRMYQQLGIMYLAEHNYKKVLKVQNDYIDKYPNLLDLKREAAFNLHLIYKNSGNLIAAREILYQYIVV